VIDYAVKPGQATVNATILQLPGGPMAYPLNISTLRTYHGQSGQVAGKVSLHGTVEFSGTLDLSTTLTLAQLLNEASGNGELAQGANGASLAPLTLQARPGGTATAAVFETPAGAEPRIEVEVKQRDAAKGVWGFELTAKRALIGAAAGCDGAFKRTGEVTTQFTLSNGTHFPLTVATTQPWRCKKQQLRTP
jgi:hypothetical protein